MMQTTELKVKVWKKTLMLVLFSMVISLVSCEKPSLNDSTSSGILTSSNDEIISQGEVYTVVEKMPEFPGGIEQLNKFFIENFNYPEESKKYDLEGNVYVEFMIDKDGNLINPRIARGVERNCDDEIIRVISKSPKWNAAMQNSKPVEAKYMLPIQIDGTNQRLKPIKAQVMSPREEKLSVSYSITEFGNKVTFSGRVINKDGQPLVGATAVQLGGTRGTITDANGNFNIALDKSDAKIAVSHVGYRREIITY